jgi:hypothetical protein
MANRDDTNRTDQKRNAPTVHYAAKHMKELLERLRTRHVERAATDPRVDVRARSRESDR